MDWPSLSNNSTRYDTADKGCALGLRIVKTTEVSKPTSFGSEYGSETTTGSPTSMGVIGVGLSVTVEALPFGEPSWVGVLQPPVRIDDATAKASHVFVTFLNVYPFPRIIARSF
jgi:hypothetical protein